MEEIVLKVHAKKFGANVRLRRERLGWTQEDLGKRVGISRQAIGAIEDGAYISLERAVELCEALNTRLSRLLERP